MTRNRMRVAIESGKEMKVKVLNSVETSEMDLYLCISMTDNVGSCKKSMEGSKLSDSVFLQWDVRSSVLKTHKKHQD